MKLITKNGDEITITDYTSNSFLAQTATFLEAVNLYNTFITGLQEISIQDDEGTTVYMAQGLTSDGMQVTPNNEGFCAIYYFHGAKAMTAEDEYSAVGKILMGVEA